MAFDFEGRFGSAVLAMKGQKRRFGMFRQCQRSVDHYWFQIKIYIFLNYFVNFHKFLGPHGPRDLTRSLT